MFAAAMRACCWARRQCSMRWGWPLRGKVAISPTAHKPSVTRMPASTDSDWSCSRGNPAKASVAGRTPTPMITRSAATRWPLSSTTASTLPTPSICAASLSVRYTTPLARCRARMAWPTLSPNCAANGTGCRARTVTSSSRLRRDEATSMAMKLSPMITTCCPGRTVSRICRAWAIERSTKTCGKSMPGSAGVLGTPPVAISAAS
ncbi:hypothetical protein D3C84_822680 [compost metagenome]